MISATLRSDFERRVTNIRARLRDEGLDALIIYSQKRSHVRYVSGYNQNYHTNSAVVLLPLKHDPILWIKFGFDLPRSREMSWFKDIRVGPGESNAGLLVDCAKAIRQMGLERGRIGLVASDLAVDEMSVSLDRCLRGELPDAQFEPASDLLNSLRAVKSPTEVKYLRKSAQLADEVAEALRRAIKPGKTDREVVVAAERPARLEGARCDMIISTDASKLAFPARNAKFHKGSVVTCEITIELDGYWVQTCRTLSVGKPTAGQKQVFAVSKNAFLAGVAASRPGNTVASVWHAIQDSITRDGYEKWIQYGPGHGVGLDLPEHCGVDPECHLELGQNMILVIHPALWVPKQGAGWTGGPIVTTASRPKHLDGPQSEIFEI